MLLRRKGEGLEALQHIVDTAFRRDVGGDQRIVVDCTRFRKDKDAELQQMAQFMVEKAQDDRHAAGDGPLNPYERRIVHLAVAEDPASRPRASATRS